MPHKMTVFENADQEEPELQNIVEFLKIKDEHHISKEIIRFEKVMSAPSSPVLQPKGVTNALLLVTEDSEQGLPPTLLPSAHLATPTHMYRRTLPAHCPVPQTYFPADLKSTNFSKKSRNGGLKYRSRSTPTMSPPVSAHNSDSESVMQVSGRTKKFLRRFPTVPPTEKVINYYACARVSDILLQGILYITDNYFAFYSNIFGYVNRTLIPITDILRIRKEKTAKFIPNAVGIDTTDHKTFVFSSLICRDATYRFMTHLWRKVRKSSSIINRSIQIEEVTEERGGDLSDTASNTEDSAPEDCLDFPIPIKQQNLEIESPTTDMSTPWETPESQPAIMKQIKTSSTGNGHIGISNPLSIHQNNTTLLLNNGIKHSNDYANRKPSVFDRDQQVLQARNSLVGKKRTTSLFGPEIIVDRQNCYIYFKNYLQTMLDFIVSPLWTVKQSLKEFTVMPTSSTGLVLIFAMIFLLLISALVMTYRMELLNSQFKSMNYPQRNVYKEILTIQQRIHAATANELELAINHQISQLKTIERSLDTLTMLLNAHPFSSINKPED